MNKVKILKSVLGVDENQVYPTHYQQDSIVEIGDDLLVQFISMGVVELVDVYETKVEGDIETQVAPKKRGKK